MWRQCIMTSAFYQEEISSRTRLSVSSSLLWPTALQRTAQNLSIYFAFSKNLVRKMPNIPASWDRVEVFSHTSPCIVITLIFQYDVYSAKKEPKQCCLIQKLAGLKMKIHRCCKAEQPWQLVCRQGHSVSVTCEEAACLLTCPVPLSGLWRDVKTNLDAAYNLR